MITDAMISAQMAKLPGIITEEGAKKILEHREKNEAKYGSLIFIKYDELYQNYIEAKKTGNRMKTEIAQHELEQYLLHGEPTAQKENEKVLI
jgi:hypothetical protein